MQTELHLELHPAVMRTHLPSLLMYGGRAVACEALHVFPVAGTLVGARVTIPEDYPPDVRAWFDKAHIALQLLRADRQRAHLTADVRELRPPMRLAVEAGSILCVRLVRAARRGRLAEFRELNEPVVVTLLLTTETPQDHEEAKG